MCVYVCACVNKENYYKIRKTSIYIYMKTRALNKMKSTSITSYSASNICSPYSMNGFAESH